MPKALSAPMHKATRAGNSPGRLPWSVDAIAPPLTLSNTAAATAKASSTPKRYKRNLLTRHSNNAKNRIPAIPVVVARRSSSSRSNTVIVSKTDAATMRPVKRKSTPRRKLFVRRKSTCNSASSRALCDDSNKPDRSHSRMQN